MALRIAAKKTEQEPEVPMEQEPEMPAEQEPEVPEQPEQDMMPLQGGNLDPGAAMYRDPSQGPFECSNCIYFNHQEGSGCLVVAGSVEPQGLCNLFTSMNIENETPEDEAAEPPATENAELPSEEVAEHA